MISLEAIMNEAYEKACNALDKTVEEIASESREITPRDTGELVSSQKNELEKHSNKEHIREISFGKSGPSSKYVIYVHEDLSKNHPHGSAKFLEKPVNENKDKLTSNIGTSMGGVFDH